MEILELMKSTGVVPVFYNGDADEFGRLLKLQPNPKAEDSKHSVKYIL